MAFMNWIVERLSDAAGLFWDIGLEIYDWVWPFYLAADFFFYLQGVFANLAWDFYDFAEWVDDAADKLWDILSWSNIRSLISGWLDGIEDLIDWFGRWWVWVGQEIDDWWGSVRYIVQDWIEAATQGLDDLIVAWGDFWHGILPGILAIVDTLRASWDDFWVNIFPNLVNFDWLTTWWTSTIPDVQGLIDTTLLTWFPFYPSLAALWADVGEFITSPLDWLWTRFTDWFLGPEI